VQARELEALPALQCNIGNSAGMNAACTPEDTCHLFAASPVECRRDPISLWIRLTTPVTDARAEAAQDVHGTGQIGRQIVLFTIPQWKFHCEYGYNIYRKITRGRLIVLSGSPVVTGALAGMSAMKAALGVGRKLC
jgi:hypothetical protein